MTSSTNVEESKVISKKINAITLKEIVEADSDLGQSTIGHDHKCFEEHETPLNMEDSDEESTSDEEIDYRAMMFFGDESIDHMDEEEEMLWKYHNMRMRCGLEPEPEQEPGMEDLQQALSMDYTKPDNLVELFDDLMKSYFEEQELEERQMLSDLGLL